MGYFWEFCWLSRCEAINKLCQLDVFVRKPTNIVGAERDFDLVVNIKPLGMVVHCFSLHITARCALGSGSEVAWGCTAGRTLRATRVMKPNASLKSLCMNVFLTASRPSTNSQPREQATVSVPSQEPARLYLAARKQSAQNSLRTEYSVLASCEWCPYRPKQSPGASQSGRPNLPLASLPGAAF